MKHDPSQQLSYVSLRNAIGFRIACYMVEGILQSTLECFFDAKCVRMMATILPNISSVNGYLLKSDGTKFSPNTSIGTIVNALFIENLSTTISFSDYYAKCAPISCSYTFTQTGSAIFVITILSGLFGGLTIVLRLVVFNLVEWWYKRFIGPHEQSPSQFNILDRTTKFFRFLRNLSGRTHCHNVEANKESGN